MTKNQMLPLLCSIPGKRLHLTHNGKIANPCCKWTKTDMGEFCAKSSGFDEAPVTVKDACNGSFKAINEATKQFSSDRFWTYEGKKEAC